MTSAGALSSDGRGAARDASPSEDDGRTGVLVRRTTDIDGVVAGNLLGVVLAAVEAGLGGWIQPHDRKRAL